MRLLSCHRGIFPTALSLAIALTSTPCTVCFILNSSSSSHQVDIRRSSLKLEKLRVPHRLNVRNLDDNKDDQRDETRCEIPAAFTPDSDCHRSSVMKTLVRCVAGIILMVQIMAASSLPTHAAGADAALDASPVPSASQQSTTTTSLVYGQRYWTIMNEGEEAGRIAANTALMDYAVGTINTMYYDHSGGAVFQPRDFYATWKHWLKQPGNQEALSSRDGVVNGLQWLTTQLNDPFSRYLTREQLREELSRSNHGFMGLGAIVEIPSGPTFFGSLRTPVMSEVPPTLIKRGGGVVGDRNQLLSAKTVQKLPVLTAVSPDSPAERAGLTVGDRIVAVQQDSFLGLSSSQAVKDKLTRRYQADNYAGSIELTVAKPVYAINPVANDDFREVVVGYRPRRLRLTTASVAPPILQLQAETTTTTTSSMSSVIPGELPVSGGDSLVHFQLLAAEPGHQSSSLFLGAVGNDDDEAHHERETVAYIRLTRFSKASTASFIKTIERLENDGNERSSSPSSYIIDLRNNYGGVIQEAMLTASALLRDPHAVLCYTMNSRGGFTPHDVLEYVADHRYPGYLLSREDKLVTLRQLQRDMAPGGIVQPQGDIFASPASSFASIREQKVKRGIHRVSTTSAAAAAAGSTLGYQHYTSGVTMGQYQRRAAQKKIVILVNEGTASAAEVFASALHDNGRTVALVGTRTYGKGLIQHTFPLPDGGGLRLTVAEYLTPALRHVTHVGGAQYNQATGDWIGGGINPDLYCESKQGIPSNIGADLCVGVALDALHEAASSASLVSSSSLLLQHHQLYGHHVSSFLSPKQTQVDF